MDDKAFFRMWYKAMKASDARRAQMAKIFNDPTWIRQSMGYPAKAICSLVEHNRVIHTKADAVSPWTSISNVL